MAPRYLYVPPRLLTPHSKGQNPGTPDHPWHEILPLGGLGYLTGAEGSGKTEALLQIAKGYILAGGSHRDVVVCLQWPSDFEDSKALLARWRKVLPSSAILGEDAPDVLRGPLQWRLDNRPCRLLLLDYYYFLGADAPDVLRNLGRTYRFSTWATSSWAALAF